MDSTGTVLGTSVAVYNVILDCSQMTYKEEYIKPTIDALVECFPELKRKDLEAYAKDKKDNKYIVLAKKLPYEEIQKFVEMQDAVDDKKKKINPNIKGVWFEKEYQRTYPYDSLALSVIGCGTKDTKEQDAYRQYGITCMESGKYEDAVKAFQNALGESIGHIGEKELGAA